MPPIELLQFLMSYASVLFWLSSNRLTAFPQTPGAFRPSQKQSTLNSFYC